MSTTDVEKPASKKKGAGSNRASVDLLKNKKRATTEFTLYMRDGEETEEVTLKFQSIGARDYDKLVAKHPPKPEQRIDGASYNLDTFAPALIAACSVEPEISPGDALEIWESPDWSRGDLMVLFRNAVELNNRGLDIPFSENG